VAARPIVADAVGQNGAYLEQGVSGVLVPPGDEAAFATAVADLLVDRERQQRLGAAAEQRVWREFNWDVLADQAKAAYARAVQPQTSHLGRRAKVHA
jgi:D-inositol-3-phosphate glycosyltransferase